MSDMTPSWLPANQPPPPPTPQPPSGGGGRPRGPAVVIAVVVGLVALVGTGTAGFAVGGGFTSEPDGEAPVAVQEEPAEAARADGSGEPLDCGADQRCIPSVTVTEVVDTLTAQGHECAQEGQFKVDDDWECELQIGGSRYSVTLESAAEDEDRMVGVRGSIFSGGELSAGDLSFLTWVGSIPFAEHPETIAEISEFISQNQRNTMVPSEIGSYRLIFSGGNQGMYFIAVSVADNPIRSLMDSGDGSEEGFDPEDVPLPSPPPVPAPELPSEEAE